MPDEPRKQPRKPRGKSKRWSEAELAKLSEITPADIESAQEAWERGPNDGFGGLLEAEPDKEEEP